MKEALQPLSPHQTPEQTSGYIFLHASPAALTRHLEWALDSVLGQGANLTWKPQPHLPGHLCTTLIWEGAPGTAARLASALRPVGSTYFEITERATQGSDALRIMHTPILGICTVPVDRQGNFTVTEDRIKYAFEQAAGDYSELYRQFSIALGEPWDEQLEPYRQAFASQPNAIVRRASTA
ncbi:DUF3145 family protein [Rothia nasimurium]|uniref:DUF3145 family protein n=1 Tax=Rothia nasimurium TaxID=85336 RepID=UPI001F17E7C5|nr:DUF3145 family protein [Rothia nasimurium]